jgi:hypothetical protein
MLKILLTVRLITGQVIEITPEPDQFYADRAACNAALFRWALRLKPKPTVKEHRLDCVERSRGV